LESENPEMSTNVEPAATMTVTLDGEERAELLHLVEQTLSDTRIEVHRTHTPDYRAQVIHREELLRRLLQKLRPPSA